MDIGRKIYYDKATGTVLVDTGERSGLVVETTQEQDFEAYKALAERTPESVGVLELEYGEYREDFGRTNGYWVNPKTLEIEFSYPDPNVDPVQPQEPVFQKPLTERIKNVESESAGMALELATTQYRLDQAEQEQANLLLSLVEGGVL
ncbi:hypothetical protein NYE25_17790 [Paenibacillus sp. FSL E2-8871]|uniref:hypothetical protein n=1 Tax=unclassified Paenibacillus TaxID=185978 RepID=UPI0030DB4BCC